MLEDRYDLPLEQGRRMQVDVHELVAHDLQAVPAVYETCALGSSCCVGCHMIWEAAETNRPRAPLEARAGRNLQ